MEFSIGQIAYQLVIFLLVWTILNAFVFQPWLRIEKRRQHETVLKEQEAAALKSRSQSIIERYNQAMDETRAEAERKIKQAQAQAMEQSKKIIQQARSQSQATFNQQRLDITEQQKQLEAKWHNEAERIADDVVQAIL